MHNSVKLLPVFLIVVILSSGCVNIDPQALALANPTVKQFMDEHPNANIVATYLTEEQIQETIEEIRTDCENQHIQAKDMYKFIISDPDSDLYLTAWYDVEQQIVICAVKKGTKTIQDDHEPLGPPLDWDLDSEGNFDVVIKNKFSAAQIFITEISVTKDLNSDTFTPDIPIRIGPNSMYNLMSSESGLNLGPQVVGNEYSIKMVTTYEKNGVSYTEEGTVVGIVREGQPARIPTGFTTLGAPDDWDFNSNGDFSVIIQNRLGNQVTISSIKITQGSDTDTYESNIVIEPGSSYTLLPSESGLNLGSQTDGDTYSIKMETEYEANGLTHTETGVVTGTVSTSPTQSETVTLGPPLDWDLDSNGDFDVIINNKLEDEVIITKVEIIENSETDSYEPSSTLSILPDSSYSLLSTESGLTLGSHVQGDVYSIQMKTTFEVNGLSYTDVGTVTGTVSSV